MIDWDDIPLDDEPEQTGDGLFGDNDQFKVAWQHWGGMPEFVMEDLEPWQTLTVKFLTPEDRTRFGDVIGQPEATWRKNAGIWFPKAEVGSYWDKRYRDASADEETE